MHHTLNRGLLAALLALPLAGCLSLGGEVPDQLLTLTPQSAAPAGTSAQGQSKTAIVIIEPGTDQRLNVTRVPVQIDASNIAYLQDATWVEKPSRLFRDLISETIRAKGNKLVLNEGDLGHAAETRLSGQLLDMGYDVATASAVVRFDAVLQLPDGTVRSRRFESRIPAAAEAVSVGPALNQAANQVASEVAAWIG
jgi:cholesterol transport system auxiliary component